MSKKTEYSQWDFLYKKGPLRITSMMVLVILCITQDRNEIWHTLSPGVELKSPAMITEGLQLYLFEMSCSN
jgi:hypothetical protein